MAKPNVRAIPVSIKSVPPGGDPKAVGRALPGPKYPHYVRKADIVELRDAVVAFLDEVAADAKDRNRELYIKSKSLKHVMRVLLQRASLQVPQD